MSWIVVNVIIVIPCSINIARRIPVPIHPQSKYYRRVRVFIQRRLQSVTNPPTSFNRIDTTKISAITEYKNKILSFVLAEMTHLHSPGVTDINYNPCRIPDISAHSSRISVYSCGTEEGKKYCHQYQSLHVIHLLLSVVIDIFNLSIIISIISLVVSLPSVSLRDPFASSSDNPMALNTWLGSLGRVSQAYPEEQ